MVKKEAANAGHEMELGGGEAVTTGEGEGEGEQGFLPPVLDSFYPQGSAFRAGPANVGLGHGLGIHVGLPQNPSRLVIFDDQIAPHKFQLIILILELPRRHQPVAREQDILRRDRRSNEKAQFLLVAACPPSLAVGAKPPIAIKHESILPLLGLARA